MSYAYPYLKSQSLAQVEFEPAGAADCADLQLIEEGEKRKKMAKFQGERAGCVSFYVVFADNARSIKNMYDAAFIFLKFVYILYCVLLCFYLVK